MAPRSSISSVCPECGFRFKVDSKYAGRRARCPREECGTTFQIPAAQEEPHRLSDLDETQRVSGPRTAGSKAKTPVRRAIAPRAEATADDHVDLEARDVSSRRSRSSAASTRRAVKAKSSPLKALNRDWFLKRWPMLVGVGCLLLAGLGLAFAPRGTRTADGRVIPVAEAVVVKPDLFKTQVQPFVQKHCVECHSKEDAEGGIDLTKYENPDTFIKGDARKTWEKVLAMLEIGAMPPPDSPQPEIKDKEAVVAWLNDKLFNLDCNMISDPGRVTIRRLNRAEYNNTVRDLLGVNFQPADDFPSDDVGYGFDNIGDVLSLTPLLMEKYLDAAEKITDQAIPVSSGKPNKQHFAAKALKTNGKFEIMDDGFYGLISAGSVYFDYEAKTDGVYTISIIAKAQQHGKDLAHMDLQVDNKLQKGFDVRGNMRTNDYGHQMPLKAGTHRINVEFTNDFWERDKGDRNLYVSQIDVIAPAIVPPLTGFVSTRPGNGKSVHDAAVEVLKPFVTRAFRRPGTDDELSKFVAITEAAVKDGEPFDRAIQYAVQGVLISPSFLFRVETDAKPNDPRAEHVVTDYELASRVSYFVWSSMPDQELFDLASRGELRKPEILDQQVKRMLKDSKSRALADNFAAQWLNLRSLDEFEADTKLFPEFSSQLRDDMRAETLLVFESIVKEDRSILDFLDADFTFVNPRLAKLYGLPAPKADKFEKVPLNVSQRAGVLTHASILTLTSNPDRTSPVKRGKWIMENILGTPPPPPPPNVPDLEETSKARPEASLREALAVHRESPVCASCHTTMDVLGFGFENFNAIGQWRDRDGTHPVDASGTLPSGESFKSAVELVRILKGRQKQFSRTLSEKLLTYALGRGLEYYDRCAVDEVMKRLDGQNHKFSAMILGIVNSRPFQQRRGDGERD